MSFDWNEAAVGELRACVAKGMSAGEVAAHIGTVFPGSPTRNAIIGKALRLKIKWHNLANTDPMSRFQKQRRAKITKPKPMKWGRQASAVSLPPVLAPAVPPAPNSEPCDLLGLTNESCRWPLTEAPPHMFCGAPEADLSSGCPYCPFHRVVSINRREAA